MLEEGDVKWMLKGKYFVFIIARKCKSDPDGLNEMKWNETQSRERSRKNKNVKLMGFLLVLVLLFLLASFPFFFIFYFVCPLPTGPAPDGNQLMIQTNETEWNKTIALVWARWKCASHKDREKKSAFMKNIIMALNSFFLLSISSLSPTIRSFVSSSDFKWMLNSLEGECMRVV